MNKNKLIFSLLFFLLVLVYILNNNTFEGLVNFHHYYFSKYYEDEGIVLDTTNKTLSKNGKLIHYKKSMNNTASAMICDKKNLASEILLKNNIPAPNYIIWNFNKNTTLNINSISKLKKPLVVKPINGSQGKHVYMNNNTSIDVINSINKIRKTGITDIIIEEQIKGKSYRVLMFRGELIGVLERTPAYVVGDGKTNLRNLIASYNTNQISKNKSPTSIIAINYIREQGYTMSSIIPKGIEVILSLNINSHNGAGLKNVHISNVHKDNITMFKKICKVTNITVVGIDYISNDIGIPYYKNGGGINELNSGPAIKCHHDIEPSQLQKFVSLIF
jgi:cyanophycin synthetase